MNFLVTLLVSMWPAARCYTQLVPASEICVTGAPADQGRVIVLMDSQDALSYLASCLYSHCITTKQMIWVQY